MQVEIKCPVCHSDNSKELILLKNFPISNVGLSLTKDEAIDSKVYDMCISQCLECTHIYSKKPVKIEYKQKDNFTYFTNETQKNYIKLIAKKFISKYNVENCNILEIGCGDGLFLKELNKSSNVCIGYEPSYKEIYKEPNLKIINEYFNPENDLNSEIDFIVIRHVLEHFNNPYLFLKSIINNIILNQQNSKFFIEVPNIQPTLENIRINDFIHEHVSHFSIYSLKYLLNSLNLYIDDIYTTDNNENIVAICSVDNSYKDILLNINNVSSNLNNNIKLLQDEYMKILNENDSICIWGAEGRGAGFINIIKKYLSGDEFLIDSDERKFNKYIPSAGLKISSYKDLIGKKIDCIIITTSLGRNNILNEIEVNKIDVKSIYVISENGLSKI